jgi:hypothetical protein
LNDRDACFPQKWKEQIDSGENVTGTKGKTFGAASLHTGQLTLLVQTDIFSFDSLHVGGPRLTLFILQLNQAFSSPLSLSDLQGVNLSAKTYSFGYVAPLHRENQGQYLS